MLVVRKTAVKLELIHREGNKDIDPPLVLGSSAVVISNPWAGQEFVEDLQPIIHEVAPQLAKILVPPLIEKMNGPDNIEAYGKAAFVGLNGEVEHGSALIHTLIFGNRFREAAEGTSYLPFINTRGPAGSQISFPLAHKTDRAERSHFLTCDINFLDAPAPDEIVLAIGAASAGRPHARIGNRALDMKLNYV